MSALEQWLMELLLGHSVNMLRVEAEIKARVLALLILMQKDIVSILANAESLSAMGKAGKNAVLRESNAVIADYYGRAQLQVDLFGLAEVEAKGVRRALASAIDKVAGKAGAEIRLGLGLPTENYLRTLAGDTLIQGSPAKSWWLRQSQDTAFKLANEIRIGAAQGETNAQIIKRVVGESVTAPTAKAPPSAVPDAPAPGIMPLARKNAAAVVQTSVAAVAAAARRTTFELNKDIANGITQVSTLDSHTSLTCIAYSGACWDWDYQPSNGFDLPYNGGVPRHFCCRSSEVLRMKTLREMGIDMDEPDPGQRASSSGPISAKTTFADYLKMKGETYQNEVLGPGRAELFRAGKLTPRDLVDMSGRPLKLADLRAKYDGENTFKQPKGTFSPYDPAGPKIKPDTSTPARAALVPLENEIRRDLGSEHGIFMSTSGKVIARAKGAADSVEFKGLDPKDVRGQYFTHNHPGGSTFSHDDIQRAAELKLAEVRVVTQSSRYIASGFENVWAGAVEPTFTAAKNEMRDAVTQMVKRDEVTHHEFSQELWHQAWILTAKRLGFSYWREQS